jgi:hypothetical protein
MDAFPAQTMTNPIGASPSQLGGYPAQPVNALLSGFPGMPGAPQDMPGMPGGQVAAVAAPVYPGMPMGQQFTPQVGQMPLAPAPAAASGFAPAAAPGFAPSTAGFAPSTAGFAPASFAPTQQFVQPGLPAAAPQQFVQPGLPAAAPGSPGDAAAGNETPKPSYDVPPPIEPIEVPPETLSAGDPKLEIGQSSARATLVVLKPPLEALSEQVYALTMLVTTLLAAQKTTKSSTRSASSRPSGATSKTLDPSKVRNAWLHFRYMWILEEAFRHRQTALLDPSSQQAIALELQSTADGKTGQDLLAAQAKSVWGSFTKERKEDHKSEFEAWKRTNAAAATGPQLGADPSVGGFQVASFPQGMPGAPMMGAPMMGAPMMGAPMPGMAGTPGMPVFGMPVAAVPQPGYPGTVGLPAGMPFPPGASSVQSLLNTASAPSAF